MNRTSIKVVFTVLLLGVASAVFAEHVTVQTAQQAAQSFLNSKMEGNPKIHLIDFAEKSSFPNFYVFGNEHCFAIIAADNCVHPVLGYSTECGDFSNETMPEAVYDWLYACDKGIESIKGNSFEIMPEIQSEWENLLNGRGLGPKSRSHVEPLVKTRWQYGTPFNNLCPVDTLGPGGHATSGCGAVAMAQLMNYWEHPVRGEGSYSYTPSNHPEYGTLFANFGGTIYDWDNMRNVYQKTYSDAEALAVATLIYHCGVSVRMNYGPSASGTSTSQIDDALINYFNYNNSMSYQEKENHSDSEWMAMLKNDLNSERPIIYRGQNESSNVGHIFLCDGYDENDYFHFNWGYQGRWDGYYALGSLFGGANYSYVNRAIFGIFPNTTSIDPPTNVATSVIGRNVSITWNPVSNASSYKLYRDGDLIASNITNTNLTDVNVPYGEHCYYLKSVKSDGTMSLKSTTTNVNVHFSGPVSTNLQATVCGQNADLSWNIPQSENGILQYGNGNLVAGLGGGGNGLYWGQRFSTSVISDYAGMAVQKVSFYCRRSGTYTVSIYKGDEANPRELVYQQNYQASSTNGWQDVNFSDPVPIDYTKDLWVVFYADNTVSHPASFCTYSGSGIIDAALYSSVSGGTIWKEFVYNGNTCSWLMKTYLTDGSYTYNLYRNGNVVATNLTGNTYTDSNLPDGFYNYHVTTNYFGGESDPSNNVNVQIGTPSSQMSSFAGGWNWWNSYVELGGASGLQMLEEGLGANGSMIKSQTQFVQCNGGVWSGGLNGINNESSYKIQTLAACEVETNGSIASPLSHPITLNPGWNWIGYPCHTAMSVTTAFSGITPSDGDEVKSQGGFSQYLNGMWSGSLNTIIPGMGLLYHSNNGQVVTLVYPEIDRDAELGENVTAEDNHWFSDIHAYPNNMTVTAVVELDGEELKSEQYELAVFSGDECRGSVRLMRVGHADRYMAFLTVSGDEITELRFGLYDTESGEEYCNAETALTYETDVTVGNVGDPYVVRFRGATDKKEDAISQVLVFPNPANDMLTIQGEGIIRVAVLNVIGQVVEDLESEDQKQICMNVHVYEQALYFLRIQTESGTVIKRFIKK